MTDSGTRQRIARLLKQGRTAEQVAVVLDASPRTVQRVARELAQQGQGVG